MKTFTDDASEIIFLCDMDVLYNMRTALCDMGAIYDARAVLCGMGMPCDMQFFLLYGWAITIFLCNMGVL